MRSDGGPLPHLIFPVWSKGKMRWKIRGGSSERGPKPKPIEGNFMELYKSTEIEFTHEKNNPYRYHTTLTHFPTGWVITQVSERSRAETKNLCLKELTWRLKHKEEYEASRINHSDD